MNRAQYQRMADCLAAGHRILGKGLRDRRAGIAYLQEGIQLADLLRIEDAWISGATDLAGLLMRPDRVKQTGTSYALDLITRAVANTRRLNGPNLGALLTNRAEIIMRQATDRDSLTSARKDLEEALPLRNGDIDRAYTLHGIARTYQRMPSEAVDERLHHLDKAGAGYNSAVSLWRGVEGEEASFARAVINLSEVCCSFWALKRRAHITRVLASESGGLDSAITLADVDLSYGLWELAGINPSLLDGLGDLAGFTGIPAPSPNEATREEANKILMLITEAQDALAHPRWSSLWSRLQYERAQLREQLLGDDPMQVAADREIGLQHYRVEMEPEQWCTWARGAMDAFAKIGDIGRAAELGLLAVEAF